MPDRATSLITPQLKRLHADFGLRAVTASEIEFYLHGAAAADITSFRLEVDRNCRNAGIGIFKHEKEKGCEQYEIALSPAAPEKTARDTIALKAIIEAASICYAMTADFSARPLASEPGSGLHIHVHLENDQGSVFQKADELISDALKFSIGGLLAWLPDCMPVFAPNADSYARFVATGQTPVTVSWGGNNRTVAVRLPDAPRDMKRIEHRMAGADADPVKVIAVILAAMHDGLTRKLDPGKQIYGDAALPMYELPKFPMSENEALARMQASEKIKEYFGSALF